MTKLLPDRSRFAAIDTWVFDLDNTLYPQTADLWPKIDARITLFMMRLFGLDAISLRALQKHYYRQYGTTLRGLMTEHGIDAQAYLAFVHDIDRSSLAHNHSLAEAIAALPGRKLILTNASRHHAVETAKQLGIDHCFEDIFDIIAADFINKPEEGAYMRFFEKLKIEPKRSVIFEDIDRNLVVPHARGMTTVLVLPAHDEGPERELWEIATGDEPHVDFVTDDLVAFLEGLIGD
ncbi:MULTISPECIES: pyrimidine 5'-nucleotidase [Methylocystis]|uniref:Pyrimidine 5'-nucleotidase n=1 Tax=Methylocystis rosea TaxID=173366 RepID=A0ABX6EFQ6_9HYPH|nr:MULTISPECIES: pyrimidine 5'-nucleotidase [Methylocystis]PWB90339.1 pyrimidine 5'-nucleotidase [Methylocystis sp. MitZ-2018]QGM93454.1 pyrimidine 5'-nucleotidase [Methylocystis rosea]ULO24916.1 pyrimidine 5'-nucleotidase [Methylocystis sp. SB2]